MPHPSQDLCKNECGNLQEYSYRNSKGIKMYRDECHTCRGRYRYGIIKAKLCEDCGFVPIVSAQLEIDHIDGNSKNNNKDNLQTLCCNCHALKSYNQDLRFTGKNNPMWGKTHSDESMNKIKEARKLQIRGENVICEK